MQNLLYGHGDVWQRMRLFTLMARQQGIEVVTLAFPGRTIPPAATSSGRPASYCKTNFSCSTYDLEFPSRAKIGREFPHLRPEILAHASQLKNLEIDEKHPYQIDAQDLKEVVALVDVVGANLAQRTQVAEQQLVGESRTILTVPITALAANLARVPESVTCTYGAFPSRRCGIALSLNN